MRLAIPTVVQKLPVAVRRIIDDLSITEMVLIGLDLMGHRYLRVRLWQK